MPHIRFTALIKLNLTNLIFSFCQLSLRKEVGYL